MGLWSAAAWIFAAAYNFVFSTVTVRALGTDALGLWATVVSLRGFLTFVDGGLAFGVTRDAALAKAGDAAAHRRIHWSWNLYFAIAGLALVLATAGAPLPAWMLELDGPAAAQARLVTLLVGLDVALAFAGAPVQALLRGTVRFKAQAVAALVQSLLGAGLLLLAVQRWGLPGALAASAAARAVVSVGAWAWLRREERPLLSRPARASGTGGAVVRFAAPLWVTVAGTQLGMGTDVLLVGNVYGPVAAGEYALGSLLPGMGASLLFALLAVAFPRAAVATAVQLAQLARQLVFLGCALAALGLGFLVANASGVFQVWVGTAPPLSVQVLVLYAAVWGCNLPAHVLASLAIARGKHHVMALFVIVEGLASLTLSIALVLRTPTGPAWATLATLIVSNLVVVPILLLRRLELPARPFVVGAATGYGTGIVGAGLAAALASPLGRLELRLGVGLLVTLGLAALVRTWAMRPQSMLHRLAAVVFLGGWRVLWRQHREVREVRRQLEVMRHVSPVVWVPSAPPLVTVRIATYNRGRLVAERAIASASAQTYANIEIVVVGDRCDAATEAAVRSVRDPRVRFENLPERGRYPSDPYRRWMVAGAAPMNRALELARGEWLAPLDDDDEFTPDHVAVLLDACRTRDLDFAWGKAANEAEPGVWNEVGSPTLHLGGVVHAAVLYSLRLRALRHDIECWRILEPGDWNLWQRMRAAGARMGFVDRVVCRHYLEMREVRTGVAPTA